MKNIKLSGIFLANHNQDTGLKYWSIERWKKEIADLKQMGAETIWYLPFQFGQRSPADLMPDSPHMQLQVAIGQAIYDAGLKVGIYQGLNDVFPETLTEHPEWKAEAGKYFLEEAHATPSIPEAWGEIMNLRHQLFAQLPHVDFMVTPATDYGGDGSADSAPWPLTYLRCYHEQAELMRSHHPEVKIVAAGHGLPIDELDQVRTAIEQCEWIDYVTDIPRGCGKPVIKYYMYPEITMLNSWGVMGTAPCLKTIEKLYRAESDEVQAVVAYSEGIHDDVNKYAALKLSKDTTLSAETVACNYAKEWLYLDVTHAERMAQIILSIGNPTQMNRIYVDASESFNDLEHDDAIMWMNALREQHTELNDNIRFWLLFYCAICEAMAQTEGHLSPEKLTALANESREAFLRLEPEYGTHIQNKHPILRPGVQPWVWPRTAHAAWQREMARSHGKA